MIIDIGNIIVDKIKNLPFIDKIAGVIKPVTYSEELSENKYIKKTFPIACNVNVEECTRGQYMDLCPDSSKKSVTYLEDKYVRYVKREGDKYYFTASLDLICWLNLPLLGVEQCSVSAKAILSIITALPGLPTNEGIFQSLMITPLGEESKARNPFAKWSYDEQATQYLLYPYDYFQLPLQVDFVINRRCIADFQINDPLGCNPLVPTCCEDTPVPSPYLTCTTLSDCALIISILNRLDALENNPVRFRKTALLEGECDGSNQAFVFEHTPIQVIYQGKVLLEGIEYDLAGNTVTLTFIPFSDENIWAYSNY